jgi:methyltransferase (TIGR00027 family)
MRGGEASWTARRVAAQRLHFQRTPTVYGRPDEDQRLLEDVAAGIDVGEAPLRRYLQARTAFVDRAVVGPVDDGVTQAVLVGAGYDGRALRYARDGLSWFEVDHPDTQEEKRARLDRLGLCCAHVSFVPVDLSLEDVGAALAQAGHDAAVATVFVCEGIAPYLPTDALIALLTRLSERAAVGSTLVLELPLVPRGIEARSWRERLATAVTERGEPLRSAIRVEDLEGMLNTCGWFVRRATDPAGEQTARSRRSTAFVLAHPQLLTQPLVSEDRRASHEDG